MLAFMGRIHFSLTLCTHSPAPLHPPPLPFLTGLSPQDSGLGHIVRESASSPGGLHLELEKVLLHRAYK